MTENKQFAHIEVVCGDVTTVRFKKSKLDDDGTLAELQSELLSFVEQEKPQKLLIDFSEVRSCSSLLINCMLRLKKLATQENPGQLKLCMKKQSDQEAREGLVFQAFQMLHLDDRVFDIFETPDEAEAAF